MSALLFELGLITSGIGHTLFVYNIFSINEAIKNYLKKKPDIFELSHLSTQQFKDISLERIEQLIDERDNHFADMNYLMNNLIWHFGNKASLKCAQVLELLLKKSVRPFAMRNPNNSFFFWLIKYNCVEIIHYFLEKNVPFLGHDYHRNCSTRDVLLDNKNYYALEACRRETKDIVKMLVRYGIDLEEKWGPYHYTFVKAALRLGDDDLIIFLINNGAFLDYDTLEYLHILNTTILDPFIDEILEFEGISSPKNRQDFLMTALKKNEFRLVERLHYMYHTTLLCMYTYSFLEKKHGTDFFEKIMKQWSFGRPKELKRLGHPLSCEDYKNKKKLGYFCEHADVYLNYLALKVIF